MKKPLIILSGPTASGKTALSIALAKAIHGEIISADSMQVYKYMDIGTAKISPSEMAGVPHHLIDVLEPDEPFNIQVFQQLAKEALDTIWAKGKVPILVGGTGFYIQSVLYDIDFEVVEKEPTRRLALEKFYDEMGEAALFEKLKAVDPDAAEQIHPNNVKRVIRAIEYFEETGERISLHNETQRAKETPYNVLFYTLNMDRSNLYKRINERVDHMFENGLVLEVEALKAKGYHQQLISMHGIGYKEVMNALDGKYDMAYAKYLIKRDTRHFAKRQVTWFKREPQVIWLNQEDFGYDSEEILNKILKDVELVGIL